MSTDISLLGRFDFELPIKPDHVLIPGIDYISIGNIGFEWAQSYDLKDWERLRKILAPAVTLDFRGIKGVETLFENLSTDEFVTMLSNPELLGNKRLQTQHLMGLKKYELLDDGRICVHYQMRAAHQLYNDDDLTSMRNKGHGHGVTTHTYQKIEEEWKLAVSASTCEWTEFDLLGTLAGKETTNP